MENQLENNQFLFMNGDMMFKVEDTFCNDLYNHDVLFGVDVVCDTPDSHDPMSVQNTPDENVCCQSEFSLLAKTQNEENAADVNFVDVSNTINSNDENYVHIMDAMSFCNNERVDDADFIQTVDVDEVESQHIGDTEDSNFEIIDVIKSEDNKKTDNTCIAEEVSAQFNAEELVDNIVVSDGYQCNICEEIFDSECQLVSHVNSYMDCQKCDLVFCNRLMYKLHVSSHTTKEIFQCDQCSATFGVRSNFDQHKHAHKTGDADLSEKKFGCCLCQFRFPTEQELEKHMQTHIKKNRTSLSLYECAYCSKCFTAKSNLISHIRVHTKEKPFKCEHCGKCFRQKSYFRHHSESHYSNFECDICGANFRSKIRIIEHMKNRHLFGKQYACTFCNKKLTSKYALRNHVKMHTKEGLFPCDICSRTYQSLGNLRNHFRLHSNEKSFLCEFCTKKFVDKGSLKKHVRTHLEDKVKCEYCFKKIAVGYYSVHLRLHTGEKPYKCTYCGKRFMQCSGLKTHQVVHTNEKRYECSFCPQKFIYKSHQTRHVVTAHITGGTHRCSVCKKGFFSAIMLENHSRSHTGEKPFQCDLCSKRFSQKSNLLAHKKALHHGDQKPFKCTLCDRAFFTNSRLKYHLISHGEDKRFTCEYCHKSFKHKPTLNEHIQSHMNVLICHKCNKVFSTKSNLYKHLMKHTEVIIGIS